MTNAMPRVTKDWVTTDAGGLGSQTCVIVVAYNSGAFLRECIVSVLDTEPQVQIVVVDNSSADSAVEQIKAEFPFIDIVRSAENVGFGGGCNLGAARAEREYFVFLNHDAQVRSGWLETLVQPLAEDSTLGLVTPKILLQDHPDTINVAGLDVHLSGLSLCRGLGEPDSAHSQPAEVAAVSGAAFSARRSVFESVGGFDEDFFLYQEDVDLSIRIWLAGYRCLYMPDSVVLHHYSSPVPGRRKVFYLERGRYLVLLKSFKARTLLALFPTLLVAEAVTFGWSILREPLAVLQKLSAWVWVVTHWSQIADKRRQVQACRAVKDGVVLDHCNQYLSFEQMAGPKLARAAGWFFSPFFHSSAAIVHWAIE